MNYIINDKKYGFYNNIKDNTEIRHSFNELATKTFGISFENWHNLGYWTNKYIPHILMDGNKVVSNVSVNIVDCSFKGKAKRFIQLGTVMTDENYRHQGLSKLLMEIVLHEWTEKCHGIYLYANDSVVDFYPKFGFQKENEIQHYMDITNGKNTKIKLEIHKKTDLEILHQHIVKQNSYSQLTPTDYEGLLMFYCSQFMKNNIYYLKEYDIVAIAEFSQDEMLCYELFGNNKAHINDILLSLSNKNTKKVKFGFTPIENNFMQTKIVDEEDTTFFWHLSKDMIFKDKNIMFPILSHS